MFAVADQHIIGSLTVRKYILKVLHVYSGEVQSYICFLDYIIENYHFDLEMCLFLHCIRHRILLANCNISPVYSFSSFDGTKESLQTKNHNALYKAACFSIKMKTFKY